MKSFGKTILAAVLGGCISLGAYKTFDDNNPVIIEKAPVEYSKTVAHSIANNPDGTIQVDFSYAAEKTTPAVVHIRSTMKASKRSNVQSLPPALRDFFGDQFELGPGMSPQPSQASGSGVIISDNGYIVTNNHVIESASELEVTLYDKRSYKATVIGTDPSTDIALIKIDAKNLPKLTLGNSDDVKVGQWVLAVGNPFNLNSTVTAGIVSAKGRNNVIRTEGSLESFIQTDAAVNPGNSGGALVNLNGELIGINTAIFSQTGSYAGYSFAVPTSIVNKVVEDLIQYGKVQRALLGVQISDLNATLAKEAGVEISEGVYIGDVQEDGAAKAAGIKKGDVIVKVDNRPVRSSAQLQEQIGIHKPGDKVAVVVNRQGKEQTFNITLKGKPENAEIASASSSEILRNLGADLANLSAAEKEKLNVKGGAKVTKLYFGKLRAQTDMREGFIITKVNRQTVKSVEEFVNAIKDADGGVMVEGVYPDSSEVFYYAFGM